MSKYLSYVKCILLISCLVFAVAGCSLKKSRKLEDMSHAELLQKGLEELKKGDLPKALANLQMVKARYPYTDSAIVASLDLADTYYKMNEFATAYDLYNEFERYHPKDPHIPYIKYQKGMCNFAQIKGFDREQTHVQKARVEFERLINQFPNSEYTVMARRHLRKCILYLTKFEIYTGNFYFKQGKYLSALQRYTYAIKNYPDLGQYHEALEKISICKSKLAKSNKVALTRK